MFCPAASHLHGILIWRHYYLGCHQSHHSLYVVKKGMKVNQFHTEQAMWKESIKVWQMDNGVCMSFAKYILDEGSTFARWIYILLWKCHNPHWYVSDWLRLLMMTMLMQSHANRTHGYVRKIIVRASQSGAGWGGTWHRHSTVRNTNALYHLPDSK